ncbi:hypothetical protein SAMN04487891_102452 [Flagellimonas taeanensis]|uniref:Secreted protein n=1 Tax=Flagellimonas taeanensis TaxID=1005926 RepID=A0A1I1E2B3_9FLAO|nr:hypothetical protein [Allomuricauda taeanensis]SFB80806.1 hypothetical protein SAMN04487891_102452 [Allomuricauda taeanensis]
MKTILTTMILILFSSFIVSCTADDFTEDTELNSIEKNIQGTGDDDSNSVDETEKG